MKGVANTSKLRHFQRVPLGYRPWTKMFKLKVWEPKAYLWRWRSLTWWREVVVVSEECGDEYILPEYTMSTPSTKLYITATKLPTLKHPRPAKRSVKSSGVDVCRPSRDFLSRKLHLPLVGQRPQPRRLFKKHTMHYFDFVIKRVHAVMPSLARSVACQELCLHIFIDGMLCTVKVWICAPKVYVCTLQTFPCIPKKKRYSKSHYLPKNRFISTLTFFRDEKHCMALK